ncbi:hypothetical protein PG987_012034 [Apiospora arundinis]
MILLKLQSRTQAVLDLGGDVPLVDVDVEAESASKGAVAALPHQEVEGVFPVPAAPIAAAPVAGEAEHAAPPLVETAGAVVVVIAATIHEPPEAATPLELVLPLDLQTAAAAAGRPVFGVVVVVVVPLLRALAAVVVVGPDARELAAVLGLLFLFDRLGRPLGVGLH